MANISILTRLVSGIQRSVDLSTNTLVVSVVKVGGGSGTDLTKTILDNLVTLQNGSDAGSLHIHDARYYTQTQTGSSTSSSGSDLVGDDATYSNFTPAAATVKGALSGIDAALGAVSITPDFSDSVFRIHDNGDATKKAAWEVSAITTGTTRTITVPDANVNLGLISTAIQSSEKGANSGVATLDSGGKVPVAQLPSSVMTYEGTWNANTNTPTLANGTGDAGMVYLVSTAGSTDFGAGAISFAVGDWAVYSGSIWQKSLNSNAVVSVNGYTGVVALVTDDIAEDGSPTNLWFTDARAQAATIAQVITNGVTTKAPSEDAVFDALALKQTASANLDEADTFFGATAISGAQATQLVDGSNADSLHAHSVLKEAMVAGESMAATTLWALRFAKAADSGFVAGRVYKADYDSTSADNFYAMGLAYPAGSVSAAGAITMTKMGLINVPSHGFTVGAPLFLGASGVVTATAPSTSLQAVVRVGMVRDANNIEVRIEVVGVN